MPNKEDLMNEIISFSILMSLSLPTATVVVAHSPTPSNVIITTL